MRLKGGKCWTLLTTMTELKGFEEKQRRDAAQGRRARRAPGPQDLAGAREAGGGRRSAITDAALLRDHRRRPGRHRPRRAAASGSACRRIIVEKNERPGDSWRKRYKIALPARPGLVRPPALPALPRPLAGLLAQGQDRRLAGDVHQGHGAQLLALAPSARARSYDEATQEWTVHGRARRRDRRRCGRSSWCWRPACRRCRTCRRFPAPRRFKGEQHHSSQHPGGEAYARQEVRGDRLQQLGPRHLRRPVGARRRRDDDAALVDPHRALRLADGAGARRPLLRSRRWRRHHHRQGRPDLRLDPLQDHARASRSRSTRRWRSATPTSTSGSRRPASCSTSATTARACS